MTEKSENNKILPDFKQLNDRIIAEPTSSPSLVIKTNVDPKDATEQNPYASSKENDAALRDFFDEE